MWLAGIRVLWALVCVVTALLLPRGEAPDWACDRPACGAVTYSYMDPVYNKPIDMWNTWKQRYGSPWSAPQLQLERGETVTLGAPGVYAVLSKNGVLVRAEPGYRLTDVNIGYQSVVSGWAIYPQPDADFYNKPLPDTVSLTLPPYSLLKYVRAVSLPVADAARAQPYRQAYYASTEAAIFDGGNMASVLSTPPVHPARRLLHLTLAIGAGWGVVEFIKRRRQPWRSSPWRDTIRFERLRRLLKHP